ncbi:MAG: ACT domain-containing protein [Candidatus Altiarchaeota archaeon]|nr:ACT domain-containing protein [Candidatus Altiarchaeota archaeon]
MGFANNRSLARLIQKDVNAKIGHNASLEAIAVSIQRISQKMKENVEQPHNDIFSRSQLQLRDNIHLLYLKPGAVLNEPKPDTVIDASRRFYVKIRGIGSTTVLIDEDEVEQMNIRKEDVISRKTDLSAIIITSPKDIVDTPGVIAHLMAALGGSKINVVEVTSSYDTTFLIVERKESLRAVEVVRSLINRSRRK